MEAQASAGGLFVSERLKGAELGSMQVEHRHSWYEIYLFLGREMTHFTGDRNYALAHRDMMLVGRSVYHRTRYQSADRERILVSFDEQGLGMPGFPGAAELDSLFALRKLRFSREADRREAVDGILRLDAAFSAAGSPASLARARFALLEVLALLIDLRGRSLLSPQEEELSSAELRVAAVIRRLNECYPEKIELEALAQEFFIGKYTLCHEFKRVTGATVFEYLNRKRLHEASRLLQEGDESVTSVAHATGFGSISHFNEQFKEAYGCAPGEYRKK